MRPRSVILGVGLLAAIIAVLFVLAILPRQPGATRANLERIQEGMNLQQVEALLGSPGNPMVSNEGVDDLDPVVWFAEGNSVAVVQFRNGLVIEKSWQDSNETWIDRWCRRLHLPKWD